MASVNSQFTSTTPRFENQRSASFHKTLLLLYASQVRCCIVYGVVFTFRKFCYYREFCLALQLVLNVRFSRFIQWIVPMCNLRVYVRELNSSALLANQNGAVFFWSALFISQYSVLYSITSTDECVFHVDVLICIINSEIMSNIIACTFYISSVYDSRKIGGEVKFDLLVHPKLI